MDLFHIEPGLMLWTWISFAILFLILYKFVFPTLISNMQEREKQIADAVDDAEMIRKSRGNMADERAALLKKAQTEGDEILRRIREDADLLKKDLAERAEVNASGILDQAKIRSEEERVMTLQQLKAELAEFVCETSEKIIGRSFVTEEDQQWTRELADQL